MKERETHENENATETAQHGGGLLGGGGAVGGGHGGRGGERMVDDWGIYGMAADADGELHPTNYHAMMRMTRKQLALFLFLYIQNKDISSKRKISDFLDAPYDEAHWERCFEKWAQA